MRGTILCMIRRGSIPVQAPSLADLGIPEGTKESGQRADFRPSTFDLAIEGHGYRLAWTRATFCPCIPLNNQTEQANPTCPVCNGTGYAYFGQRVKQDPAKIGQLSHLQASIIQNTGAMVIRGLMTGIGRRDQTYTELGHYREGEAMCTVRPNNTLGRLDRLVQLDSYITYTQKLVAGDPGKPLALRYPALTVNLLAATTDNSVVTRYIQNEDFTLVLGNIVWRTGRAPAAGTSMAAHYLCMPTWLVTEQPHSVRMQNVLAKVQTPLTPEGDLMFLPLQAQLKLEWLVGDNTAGLIK